MNIFEWMPMSEEPKEDKKIERPCLIWVYDKDLPIGYVDESLAYWAGGRWVDHEEKPLVNHPDMKVTYWCYVPQGRLSRKPPTSNNTQKRVLQLVDKYLAMQPQSDLIAADGGMMTWAELRQHIEGALNLK